MCILLDTLLFGHIQFVVIEKVCDWLFFFFQAEDGIRDLTVTGVQTCALPIFPCARCPCRGPWESTPAEAAGCRAANARGVARGAPRGAQSSRRARCVRHCRPAQIGRASCRERV